MNATALVRQRLLSQRLASAPLGSPAQVVAWFGALQAQDYPHAKWAVGLRCAGATDAGVEQAIADRAIVRTWAMRGTLQLIAAQDVRWLLQLVGPRLIARGAADDRRRFGLDAAEFTAIDRLFEVVLRGKSLTRKETYAALEEGGISTDGQRGYHILNRAGLRGQICFGPPRGKEETFVLLEEWLPPAPALSREAALAEMARRYFQSHGPATLQDFAWWSSLTLTDARAAIDGAKAWLRQEVIDNTPHWLAAERAPAQPGAPAVQLLPGFDEYVLGYTDRSAALDPSYSASAIHSNGVFRPTILVNGRVVGVWGRSMKKGSIEVRLDPFVDVSRAESAAIASAVERYRAFVTAAS